MVSFGRGAGDVSSGGRWSRALIYPCAAMILTVALIRVATAQTSVGSFGGDGGAATATGGRGGAFEQAGKNGDPGLHGGGGGGPGTQFVLEPAGGAGGTVSSGGGGAGGRAGMSAETLQPGSFNGGNGGDAVPSADRTNLAGGGGGSGGYGYVLTTAGSFTTTAGQIFRGGNGGAGNGVNGDAGVGGSGGGGVFLALGGTFINVSGASAFGGNAGTTPITNICAGGFVCGPGGDGLINFGRATIVNAGTLAGGISGIVVPVPGVVGNGRASMDFGGAGVNLNGGGSITNTATGLIVGGSAGDGFGGNATTSAGGVGTAAYAIFTAGGLEGETSITNDGRIFGGSGTAGTVGAPGSRPVVASPSALLTNFDGGNGGGGIIAFLGRGAGHVIVNNPTGLIAGGAGGNGGGGFVDSAAPRAFAGAGGVGGIALDIDGGRILNFGSIAGGAAGRGADATAVGEVGGSNGNSSGGTAVRSRANIITVASLDNRGHISGGNAGLAGLSGAGAAGASGGQGGIGVDAEGAIAITNSGVISGGAGSAGGVGSAGVAGSNGAGGAGVVLVGAGNATIVSNGTISGGLNGGGITRANAIDLYSGVHMLTLLTGAAFNGNVVVNATSRPNTSNTAGVAANNTLNLDSASSGTVLLSQFQNFGHLTQTGMGSSGWTLTGAGAFTDTLVASGTLSVAAATTLTTSSVEVNGGLLSVNGTIAPGSLTTVNSGGMIGGNGSVGSLAINGGTLSPGNSVGLLTVQGNLVLTAASSYLVEVSQGNADRVNVSGSASLGGATVSAVFAPGSSIARHYTIVNAAGGVIGAFNALVSSNVPVGFQPSLNYDSNNAYLEVALNLVPATPVGLNINQTNVANALTGFFDRTGSISRAFGTLTPAGLTIVSGELPTVSQQTAVDAMGLFLGLMTDPFIAGRAGAGHTGGGTIGYAEAPRGSAGPSDALNAIYRKAPLMTGPGPDRNWSVWSAGYGGSQTTDGNAVLGSSTATSQIGGAAAGADYRFSPATQAGFALAGGGTRFAIANGRGSGGSDLFQAGAFVRHTAGPSYITAALAYGWQDVTTDRVAAIGGGDVLRGRFTSNAVSGRLEGGYRYQIMGAGLTPYAAGQFTNYYLPDYSEQVLGGAGLFALNYMARDVTASRSELGLRSDKSFAVRDGLLTLRGRGAWAHDFNNDRSITATFQSLPGASFVVNGAAPARDAALISGSTEMTWRNGWSVAATFEGQFSDVTRSYAGKGAIRYAW